LAPENGRTDPSVEEELFARGYEFDFFQAVRLLRRIYPRRREVGGSSKATEELARFGAHLSMAFPASPIHEIARLSASSDPAKVIVAFFGLTGTQGILPLWYTEQVIARRWADDDTLASFFDLFNHRLISLFYRAWHKHRPAILYEQAKHAQALPDSFTHSLFDLIGMGTGGLRGRLHVRDESLLFYSGLIAQRPHSASALQCVLRDYFRADIAIEQCLGDWYDVAEADQTALGDSDEHPLGDGALLGDQVWDQQSRFRIRVGPLPLARYMDFLPEGSAMASLVDLTRFFAGQAASFDVQVILRRDDVPACSLDDQSPDSPRLGCLGWLKTGDFENDADDAVFRWVN